MPKLKTRKGVAKRLRLTKKGKVKFGPCGKSHLNTSKTTAKVRRLRRPKTVEGSRDIKYIKRMLPYG